MKKILTLLLCLSALPSFSQEGSFNKGTIAVSAGYGVPNLVILPFRVAYKIADFTNVSLSGFGPVLMRAEYGLSKKIGLGLSGGYSTMSVGYTYKDWDIYKGQKIDYHAKLTWTSPSLGARFNLHFGNKEKMDPYFGIGLGWSGNKLTYSDDSPWEDKYPTPKLGGVYYNIGLGFRYYFAKFAGFYMEIGLDKASLLQAGVAVKF